MKNKTKLIYIPLEEKIAKIITYNQAKSLYNLYGIRFRIEKNQVFAIYGDLFIRK